MKLTKRHALAAGVATAFTVGAAFQVEAGAYPDHAIRMIVAWPAGGGTDAAARIVARYLGDRLGQPVVVDNRGGASGVVGTDVVAHAPADGYTVQYTVADSHSVNPHVFANLKFDALKDFIPIAMVGSMPNSLVVNAKVPANTLAEFIALAKSAAKPMTYATWGMASSAHIRTEAFKSYTGIDLLHVPYQGSGPAISAVMAGQVDSMMAPYGLAEPGVKAGKLKALSVDTPQRLPNAPDVPTFAEQGVNINLTFWQGLLVPAKVPQAIVERLHTEMQTVLADPRAEADLARVGVAVGIPGTASLVGIRRYYDAEYTHWGNVIKQAGIRADQ